MEKEKICKYIVEIVDSSDLNVLTRRQLREKLQEEFPNVNISQHKQEIDGWIDDVLLSHASSKNETNNDDPSPNYRDHNHSSQPLISEKTDTTRIDDDNDNNNDDDNDNDINTTESTIPHKKEKRQLEENDDNDSNDRQRQRHKQKKKMAKIEKQEKQVKKENPFNRPLHLSAPLSSLLGHEQLSRPQVVKGLWSYIKSQNLQDRSFVNCDEKLKAIFKKDRIHCFTMNKILSSHLMKPEEISKSNKTHDR